MTIRVTCPSCQKAIKAPDTYAGKTAKCPSCRSDLTIPQINGEETLSTIRPEMFRNHPIGFCLCVFGLFSGVVALFEEFQLAIIAFLFWGGILTLWYLNVRNTLLTITTKRAILRRGFLSIKTSEVRHADVRLLEVRQNILQRMFDVGSVAVATSAHGGIEIQASGLYQPLVIKEKIEKLRP
jgi:uncharacterized membrane protein YdbT with pleckstrin-like domain